MNSKQITEMVLDEDIKSRFGLSASGSMGEAEDNSQEHKKREPDMNNPGRDAFDAKHDSAPQPTAGLPFTSPNAVEIPIPENPVDVKISLNDAVDFIRQWEGVKSGEMRPAFAESHLKNIAMEDYLAELKARTEAAQQYGHSQIVLPAMPQAIYAGEAKGKDDDDYTKQMMATLAPFAATQKLFGMGDSESQAEKPTEVAKTIMEMGRSMADMNTNNQTEPPKITEVIDSIVTVAEKLSGGNSGNSKMEEISSIVELAKTFSDMKEDASKIQVPNPDGTFTEMPASQYFITQLLSTKNDTGTTPPTENADIITITDAEGVTKKMPVAVYMAEQMMNKNKPDESTGKEEQPNSKLLSALVGTVERLSTNMNDLQRKLSEQNNPLGLMNNLMQQSEAWHSFREKFMGTTDSSTDERERAEEKKREHELELKRIEARKESNIALASLIPSPSDNTVVTPEENHDDFQRHLNERLIASQQNAKSFSGFHSAQVMEITKRKEEEE